MIETLYMYHHGITIEITTSKCSNQKDCPGCEKKHGLASAFKEGASEEVPNQGRKVLNFYFKGRNRVKN